MIIGITLALFCGHCIILCEMAITFSFGSALILQASLVSLDKFTSHVLSKINRRQVSQVHIQIMKSSGFSIPCKRILLHLSVSIRLSSIHGRSRTARTFTDRPHF